MGPGGIRTMLALALLLTGALLLAPEASEESNPPAQALTI